MSGVTSFSMEELAYLRGLPDLPDVGDDLCARVQALGWERWAGGVRVGSFPCCRELFVHVSPDGVWYWRHGEMLLRLGKRDVSGQPPGISKAKEQLAAIHTHEAIR
jgi:hypothetical protein